MRRQRYERTDVPKENPLRPIISLVAILVIAVGLYFLCTRLWERARFDSMRGSGIMAEAIETSTPPDPVEGMEVSYDDFENIVVYIVEDLSAEQLVLTNVRMLSINHTKGVGFLIAFPKNVRVHPQTGSPSELDVLINTRSPIDTITAMQRASGMMVDHVIVTDLAGWETVKSLGGYSYDELVRMMDGFFTTLMSDMNSNEIVKLGMALGEIGFENLTVIDLQPGNEWTDDSGKVWMTVDGTSVATQTGYLVPAGSQPVPEEAAPEGEAEQAEGEQGETEGEQAEGEGAEG